VIVEQAKESCPSRPRRYGRRRRPPRRHGRSHNLLLGTSPIVSAPRRVRREPPGPRSADGGHSGSSRPHPAPAPDMPAGALRVEGARGGPCGRYP
jgi:hypothetical protein